MLRFLLVCLVVLVKPEAAAAEPSSAPSTEESFPFIPSSTVALLRFSSLNATYAKALALLNRTNLFPHPDGGAWPPTLAAALELPRNCRANLDQPFSAALLLHAHGNLSAPFVPGYFAWPVPALLLVLPGVPILHLVQLPDLEPANDGSPSHYRHKMLGPRVRVTVGAFGSTGVLVLGLRYWYDLSSPPTSSLRLPASAVATMNTSAASLALELSQLDVLLKPLLLAGPSIFTLLGTLVGTALAYTGEFALALARLGLTPGVLGALASVFSEFFELALTLVGDTRAAVLSARLDGRSELHLGLHACYKDGSFMASLNTTPATTANLWPDLPDTNATMLAVGDHFSPAAVEEWEEHVFGPALAHLEKATQGGSLTPAASMVKDFIVLMRGLNGPTDGVQAAFVDNGGAAEAGHPNCPPDLPPASPTLLAPGVVALFARGSTVEDIWQRHNTLLSLLRTATGPGTPWARIRSRSEQALLTSGGSGATMPVGCAAILDCAECTKIGCVWSVPQEACLGAASLTTTSGLVYSSFRCPVERLLTPAELFERFVPSVELSTSSQNRTIGGVVFENRRIMIALLEPPLRVVVDTAVGVVGSRVMGFGVLSDAAVLPYVQAALRPPPTPASSTSVTPSSEPPLFADLPAVKATFAALPKSRSTVLALRPAAWLRYVLSMTTSAFGALTEPPQIPTLSRFARLAEVLEAEGATVGLTINPTAQGVPAGIEVHVDLEVRPLLAPLGTLLFARDPLTFAIPLTCHPTFSPSHTAAQPLVKAIDAFESFFGED